MVFLVVLSLHLADVDCNYIKSQIAEHGKPQAIAWALRHGYGWSDILRVKRKCRV